MGPLVSTDLRFYSPQAQPDTSLYQETTDTGLVITWCACLYIPAFAGTHLVYPQRDGQAELTWMAD